MKLIEKKAAAPELIWGNKYVTTSSDTQYGDIEKGIEVILTRAKVNGYGQVRIEVEDDYDYINPEYLQPVTVVGAEVAPKLVAGKKYTFVGDSHWNDITEGTVVVLKTTRPDADGDLKVGLVDGGDWDYIKPEQLTPVTEEALTETTYTVELDEAEATAIRKALGEVTERAVSGSGELYTEFGQLLEGGK